MVDSSVKGHAQEWRIKVHQRSWLTYLCANYHIGYKQNPFLAYGHFLTSTLAKQIFLLLLCSSLLHVPQNKLKQSDNKMKQNETK